MAHRGHPKCPFKSIAACDQSIREAMGRCTALTEKETSCTKWAIERVNDRSYCGQHYAGVIERERKARIAVQRRERMDQQIDAYLLVTGQEAHACGVVCEFSLLIQGPRLSELIAS